MAAEPSVVAEPVSDTNLDLTTALQWYMQTVPADSKQQSQSELARFMRWVGPSRKVTSLAPPEIGEYSDLVSARGTAPDAVDRLSVVKAFLAYLKKQGLIETSLAQHLRLRKGRSTSGKAKAAIDSSVVRLTKQGHGELLNRLASYRDERQGLAEEIHRAAADKDVRENAPLEAAREAQGLLMSRIAELEATLRSAVVIDESAAKSMTVVRLGSSISLKDDTTGKVMNCQIVGPNEASPLRSKVSSASPVGAAVLGRSAGDEVRVQTPRGEQVFVILKTS